MKKLKIIGSVLLILILGGYWISVYNNSNPNYCQQDRASTHFSNGQIRDGGSAHPKSGCPGYDAYQDRQIGTYKLGPYTFKIPRDYLWQAKNKEGNIDGLYFYIEYPSMKPAIKQIEEPGINNEIPLSLEYVEACPEKPCKMYSYRRYRSRAIDSLLINKTTIDQAVLDEETHLKKFIIERNDGQYHVFTSGNPREPEMWYFCSYSKPSPMCSTFYELKPGLWAHLRFSYRYIKVHENIRQLVDQQIQHFIVGKDPS